MVSYGFCSSIAVVEQWDWAERMVYEKWDTLKAFRQFIFPCLTLQEKEMEKQRLLYQQARLHNRGAAEMVLQMISACKGTWSPLHTHTNTIGSFQVFFFFFFKLELSIYCSTCHPKNTFFCTGETGCMVSSTLKLGISILNGGNCEVQQVS